MILDVDLAELYEVETKAINRATKRNPDRFPDDFMFQLTKEESENLRCQNGTSSSYGGRRYQPYVFTEQGVAMLSSVLKSKRAAAVNVEIMRTFVRMRRMMATHEELSRRIDEVERKYDGQFRQVFLALRQLMQPPEEEGPKKPPIGFNRSE